MRFVRSKSDLGGRGDEIRWVVISTTYWIGPWAWVQLSEASLDAAELLDNGTKKLLPTAYFFQRLFDQYTSRYGNLRNSTRISDGFDLLADAYRSAAEVEEIGIPALTADQIKSPPVVTKTSLVATFVEPRMNLTVTKTTVCATATACVPGRAPLGA